jgi:hypothetical protein
VSEDTIYIRREVNEMRREMNQGLQRLHDLFRGVLTGHQYSVYSMFGSSTSDGNRFGPADSEGPPGYKDSFDDASKTNEHLEAKQFRRASSQRWELVPQNELADLAVSTAEFLWRMAKVAAEVHPWNGKIRSTSRYKDGTCDFELYGIVNHLMDITENGGACPWAGISVQSWLTAAGWYLSMVSGRLETNRHVLGTEHCYLLGPVQACLWPSNKQERCTNGHLCKFRQGVLDRSYD